MAQNKLVYAGRVIRLQLEGAMLPNGKEAEIEVVRHPGGAAALAEDALGRVCMLRQYRPAIGDWLWEIPAGKLDPGETPLQTAQRELAEEAGVQAQRWRSLGAIVTTPGFCDEVIHLFLARNFTIVQPCHDAHEVIEVCWRTQSELESMIASGELRDAKTLVAIYRWLAHETA